MQLYVEHKFDTMEYWLYFYSRDQTGGTHLLVQSDDVLVPMYYPQGSEWAANPTFKLKAEVYDTLRDHFTPTQPELPTRILEFLDNEQSRVDKLIDHVMRLES